MEKEPLISIIIIAQRDPHLLHLTFESLSLQEKKNFEVILLDAVNCGGSVQRFLKAPLLVQEARNELLAETMNQGLLLAQGTYVQFFFPGDRFLSQHATAYLSELALNHHWPSLIYCAFLLRDPERAPRAATLPLHLDLLRKGKNPTLPRAYWFLKSELQKIGGFDSDCCHRPSFDLLCRLMAQPNTRIIETNRVLTDYEWRRKSAKEIVGYARETCCILYRHFGFWYALRWLFVQDHVRMWRWTWKLVKQAFWKSAA